MIGIVMSTSWFVPLTDTQVDRLATERALAFDAPWYISLAELTERDFTLVNLQSVCLFLIISLAAGSLTQ